MPRTSEAISLKVMEIIRALPSVNFARFVAVKKGFHGLSEAISLEVMLEYARVDKTPLITH